MNGYLPGLPMRFAAALAPSAAQAAPVAPSGSGCARLATSLFNGAVPSGGGGVAQTSLQPIIVPQTPDVPQTISAATSAASSVAVNSMPVGSAVSAYGSQMDSSGIFDFGTTVSDECGGNLFGGAMDTDLDASATQSLQGLGRYSRASRMLAQSQMQGFGDDPPPATFNGTPSPCAYQGRLEGWHPTWPCNDQTRAAYNTSIAAWLKQDPAPCGVGRFVQAVTAGLIPPPAGLPIPPKGPRNSDELQWTTLATARSLGCAQLANKGAVQVGPSVKDLVKTQTAALKAGSDNTTLVLIAGVTLAAVAGVLVLKTMKKKSTVTVTT